MVKYAIVLGHVGLDLELKFDIRILLANVRMRPLD